MTSCQVCQVLEAYLAFIRLCLELYCTYAISAYSMSLNTAHGEVYFIQHYVIKFVSELMQVCDFLWVFQFPPPTNSLPVYSWNSVESGDKHHNPYYLYKCKMYMPNTSIILLFNLLILCVIHDVPGESYSKTMLCALN